MEFFKLVSSAFAMIEGESMVPDTPNDPKKLHMEIQKKVEDLRVFSKMQKWTRAIEIIEPKMKEHYFFLLRLDVTENNERWK